MVSRAVARRFYGAVVGAAVIGAASLLGLLKVLPGSFEIVAFLFCGGLIAGLLTPGSVKDGAITGAVCGVLVALLAASTITLMSLVENNPQYPPFWMTFLFYALILTALLLPYSAVGGAGGTAVRNGPADSAQDIPPGPGRKTASRPGLSRRSSGPVFSCSRCSGRRPMERGSPPGLPGWSPSRWDCSFRSSGPPGGLPARLCGRVSGKEQDKNLKGPED